MSDIDMGLIIERQKQEIKHYKEMVNLLNIHSYAPEYLKEHFDKLEQQLKEAEKVIDDLWEMEPNKTEMLDKVQEYLNKYRGEK